MAEKLSTIHSEDTNRLHLLHLRYSPTLACVLIRSFMKWSLFLHLWYRAGGGKEGRPPGPLCPSRRNTWFPRSWGGTPWSMHLWSLDPPWLRWTCLVSWSGLCRRSMRCIVAGDLELILEMDSPKEYSWLSVDGNGMWQIYLNVFIHITHNFLQCTLENTAFLRINIENGIAFNLGS